jgi:acetylornithine/succinyldiaminopimelate/putrescine aminotransferase
MARLAARLSACSLGGKVFFTNSGTEAVEAALKCARKARQGGAIISLHGAFHGRTYGALSATPQESKQAPFAPLVGGFASVEPTVAALRSAIDSRTAALILEPVQGESGVHVLDDELLHAARELCDEHGATLIFDEVQTGLGRTGTAWAYEPSGVVPDLLCTAKALGGGLPIGAMVTGERHAGTFQPGDHGSTFAGGPVVCAAGLAVLDVLLDERLLARVRELGELLRAGLASLPHVTSVRGRGLMIAFELDIDGTQVVRRLLDEQRLVVNATGPGTLRLLPPLVIGEEEALDALGRIAAVLEASD